MGGVKVGDGAGSMWLVLVSEPKVVEGLGAGWAQSVSSILTSCMLGKNELVP